MAADLSSWLCNSQMCHYLKKKDLEERRHDLSLEMRHLVMEFLVTTWLAVNWLELLACLSFQRQKWPFLVVCIIHLFFFLKLACEDPRKGNFVHKLVLSRFQGIQKRVSFSLNMQCFRNSPIVKLLNEENILCLDCRIWFERIFEEESRWAAGGICFVLAITSL